MEGWDVYRELFDEIILDAEDGGSTASRPKFFILPEWAFDILHEFVYQFQGFCQFRTALHNSATKHGILGPVDENGQPTMKANNSKAPHHLVEQVQILQQGQDVWNVETVCYYLQRLVAIGTDPKCTVPAYQYLGLFASVTLSRLECLLADYTASLSALSPILSSPLVVTKLDLDPKTSLEVVHGVFSARLSLTYHAGVSFFMLRRYKDAINMLGEICSYMQRGFKVCYERNQPTTIQLVSWIIICSIARFDSCTHQLLYLFLSFLLT
jgi:translation initiation factor 3 subunit L